MKKVLLSVFVLAAVFSFTGISHASAAVVCNDPDHAIYSADNSSKEGCITDIAWRASLASQANQNDVKDLVKVIRGQKIMTTSGPEDACFKWFPGDCVIKKALFVNFL